MYEFDYDVRLDYNTGLVTFWKWLSFNDIPLCVWEEYTVGM